MVLKNSMGTFVLMGLFYGGAMALVFGSQNGDYITGAITGGIAGLIFAVVMYVVNANAEKKAKVLYQQVGCMRKVYCQGVATLRTNPINGIAGWMFLTESALEFYASKANLGGKNVPIMLETILSVEAKGNTIVVNTADKSQTFQVVKAQEWKKQIENLKEATKVRSIFD